MPDFKTEIKSKLPISFSIRANILQVVTVLPPKKKFNNKKANQRKFGELHLFSFLSRYDLYFCIIHLSIFMVYALTLAMSLLDIMLTTQR